MFQSSRYCLLLFITLCLAGATPAQDQWSTPVPINGEMLLEEEYDSYPRVASDERGNTIVAWVTQGKRLNENSWDSEPNKIAIAKSTDGGKSYGGSKVLVTGDYIGVAGIVYAGSGTWVLIYGADDSNEPFHRHAYAIRSSDFGNTWSEPVQVDPDGIITIYSGVQVATDGEGTIIATEGTQLMRSGDYGLTWHPLPTLQSPGTTPNYTTDGCIATNRQGDWVHCFGSFAGDGVRRLYANVHVSKDNGLTWLPVLTREVATGSQNSVVGDIAIDGDTIAFTATVDLDETGGPLTDTYVHVSQNAGNNWDVPLHLATDLSIQRHDVAVQNGKWMLMAIKLSSYRTHIFMSRDLHTWHEAGTPLWISNAVIAPLNTGGFTCAASTSYNTGGDVDIHSMVYGQMPTQDTASNLAIESLKPPKVKQKKNGEITAQWKLRITNLGNEASEPTFINLYRFVNTPYFPKPELVGTYPLKSIAAAKPGKRPKTKKINMKTSGTGYYYFRMGLLAEVDQAWNEYDHSDNLLEADTELPN